jgi:hypothetical protein
MNHIINRKSLLAFGKRLSLAFTLVAAVGCGGGDDDAPAQIVEPEDFLGIWSYTSGDVRVECPGAPAVTIDLADIGETERFELGTESDLVVVDSEDDCLLAIDVQGNRAVALAGQTCSYVDEDGEHITESMTSYSFTLTGTTAQEAAQMTVEMADSGITCAGSINARLEKL